MTLTSEEVENYCFFRMYSSDMNSARLLVPIIKRYRKRDVKFAILRDLTVTYARPFSVNRGQLIKKHSLPESFVPDEWKNLHSRLIFARDKQFAHTDLDFHQPKLARINLSGELRIAMSMKSFQFDQLLSDVESISELIEVIDKKLR